MDEEKKDKIEDWILFSNSYLYLVELACKELLRPYNKPNATPREITDSLRRQIEQRYKKIFIPIMYNIAHGIELFIKTLKVSLTEKFDNKDKGHDILELFEILKEEIKNHEIADIIEKSQKYNLNDFYFKTAFDNRLDIDKHLKEVEKVVKKYYECQIIKDKIEDNDSIKNKKNDIFRYPENWLKISLNHNKISKSIDLEDIKNILEDIKKLHKHFNILGTIFHVYMKNKGQKIDQVIYKLIDEEITTVKKIEAK